VQVAVASRDQDPRRFSCWAAQEIQGRATGIAAHQSRQGVCATGMSYLWSLGAGTAGNLVQWTGQPAAEATWIDLEEFQRLYHDFQLEDELLVGGGVTS
jgi:hypothetical protein